MKNNFITVVYHSGKEDLKELITKLVVMKISREEKVIDYNNNDVHITTIPKENEEGIV